MAPVDVVIAAIEEHLSENWERTAAVVAGPRREGWFTSESFVALNRKVNPLDDGGFSVYGEEALKTALAKLKWPTAGGDSAKLPDLVGYWPQDSVAPAFILEAKLVYVSDRNGGERAITDLANQLASASAVVPGVPLIALVFVASSPSPGGIGRSLDTISDKMEELLPDTDGYTWVAGERCHVLPSLDQAQPRWRSFNCYSTVALGARTRK